MVGVSAACICSSGDGMYPGRQARTRRRGDQFRERRNDRIASVFPYMFPRDFGQILQYAINGSPQVRYSSSTCRAFCRGW